VSLRIADEVDRAVIVMIFTTGGDRYSRTIWNGGDEVKSQVWAGSNTAIDDTEGALCWMTHWRQSEITARPHVPMNVVAP
jgi:hypothetical protein